MAQEYFYGVRTRRRARRAVSPHCPAPVAEPEVMKLLKEHDAYVRTAAARII